MLLPKTRLAIYFAVLGFYSATSKSITELVHLCKADDPNLDACVKDAANSLIPQFTKEVDEFGSVTFDPLFTPAMEISQDTKYVSVDLKYTNITQTGLSKMIVTEATVDLGKGLWKFKMVQPIFQIVGKYKSRGTMLKIAVNGEGEFSSTHLNTTVELVMEVSREKRANDEYFKMEKFNIYYTFGTAVMEYRRLFEDDPEMEKSTNQFLNENSHDILYELKPALEKVYSDLFRGYLERLLEKLPVTKLFI